MKSLALVGFMGSGKTTTSKELEKYYKIKSISIDEEIENNLNTSITNIFKECGEEYFRNLEHKTIKKYLDNSYILDLGGGAFIQENNRKILKEKALSIFLDVDFKILCNRLENERQSRPLLHDLNWKNKAEKLYNTRYNIYSKADITIKINNENLEDITKKVIEECKELM